MKKIGQIMEDMGFNPESSPSSKAAFIKYLAKQAYNVNLEIPEIYQTESEEPTLDSFLAKESSEDQTSNVKPIFKSPAKPQNEPKQLELNLDDYKNQIYKKAE
jgi:hypothetical protein